MAQYKYLQEGKTSQMTSERIEVLERGNRKFNFTYILDPLTSGNDSN